ncbi:uncharacterized protein METZ01_LOCUS331116, partial [marine metagenome]
MDKKCSNRCAVGIYSRISRIENRFPEIKRPAHSSGVPITQLQSATRRTHRGIDSVHRGQVKAQLGKCSPVLRLGREVNPLVRVGGAGVQFL